MNTLCEMKIENKLLSRFVKNDQKILRNVEVFFSRFLLEHNIPLVVPEHAGSLFRAIFLDSKITQT